jgi:hypothetical protein
MDRVWGGFIGGYLKDAVAVAGVAKVLQAEVVLALGELVAESLLEPGYAGPHDRPPIQET